MIAQVPGDRELVESIAYCVDIMRDAMATVEMRQGRSELYVALRDGAARVEEAKQIAMARARRVQA